MLPLLQTSRNAPAHWDQLPPTTVTGLYVHVPFCFHKCHYCDFYSITRQTPERMTRFVDLLLTEAGIWRQHRSIALKPRTVFVGGGTPSLLPLAEMRCLIDGLRARFDCSGLSEWTIECNPATVNEDYCKMLRDHGVDRLSFGAQSFRLSELAILERHHHPADVARSIDIARNVGFERLNLDLIYAIPGQTIAHWHESLGAALNLGTTHLSCYGLTYESNTPMAVRKRLGQFQAVDESAELIMLHETRSRLAHAGLPAYEVSNYASPGQECQHNLLYWNGGDYIGLGPSAASHVQGWRWRNRPHLGEWESAMATDQTPAIELENLSPLRRAGELAYLQLRLRAGVNFTEFLRRTGSDARSIYAVQLKQLSAAGLVEISEQSFHLTERGINLTDAIASEFLADPTDGSQHLG